MKKCCSCKKEIACYCCACVKKILIKFSIDLSNKTRDFVLYGKK